MHGIDQCALAVGWDLPREMRYLACGPISHAACLLVTPTLMAGGTVVLHRSFDPGRWLETVAAERITVSLLVPTMIQMLVDHPTVGAYDLSSLKRVVYGASPISDAVLMRRFEAGRNLDGKIQQLA